MNTTPARKGKIICASKFNGYDSCLNSYVGCEHACAYCYVRFFIRDKKDKWGNFLRTRDHIKTNLAKELKNHAGQRIVLGTMTDPYQPAEDTYHLTRECLQLIQQNGTIKKVGIFTKSIRVLNDINLLKTLPDPTVHMTIGPYDQSIINLIEVNTPTLLQRWEAVQTLKNAGIKVCVNVAPALPLYSEKCVPDYVKRMVSIGVRQFFTDPMQMYTDSTIQMAKILSGTVEWPQVQPIVTDKEKYQVWKDQYRKLWEGELGKYSYSLLPVWCDHISDTWVDMSSGVTINPKIYNI
jgi:DNA repair photolyase